MKQLVVLFQEQFGRVDQLAERHPLLEGRDVKTQRRPYSASGCPFCQYKTSTAHLERVTAMNHVKLVDCALGNLSCYRAGALRSLFLFDNIHNKP